MELILAARTQHGKDLNLGIVYFEPSPRAIEFFPLALWSQLLSMHCGIFDHDKLRDNIPRLQRFNSHARIVIMTCNQM